MAKIKDPVLFSRYHGIGPDTLDTAGLIDPFVDVDTQLFIDPVLLEKSATQKIRENAHQLFRSHFSDFVRLLAISRAEGDAAWRGARRLLDLQEPPENGLGYGGSGRSGSSRPDEIREKMMRTASEIIELGADDPEMISLMGFFEEDIGPDTISDFTTRVILPVLAELTEEFCRAQGIPVVETAVSVDHLLPTFINASGRTKPLLLVPSDIVRELPVANDWSDIEAAAFENERIRARVNAMLAGIARPTVSDRKYALRRAALGSSDDFQTFLDAVKEHTAFYDKSIDALGYYRLRALFAKGMDGLPTGNAYDFAAGSEEIRRLVHDTLEVFRHHVENGNLWEELWIGDKPKKERAAQLIYYAIADCYCRANNVDISPEANMGGGPVDFKFSQGYAARVLVEMKRSSGTVRHGYERQLDIYRDASQTNFGIFVVMDFGDLGDKLAQITEIRNARIAGGAQASDIIVIDATRKASASKRHKWLALVARHAINAVTEQRSNQRVLFLLDEFANMGKIAGFAEALTLLPGYGVRVWAIVQDLSHLAQVYGRDTTNIILSQSEVKQFFAVQDMELAQRLSRLLGELSIITRNYNLGQRDEHEVGVSVSERGVPLMLPQEIMALPDDRQLLFVKAAPPVLASKARYWDVAPWRDWADPNPMEGDHPRGSKPVFRLRYSKTRSEP